MRITQQSDNHAAVLSSHRSSTVLHKRVCHGVGAWSGQDPAAAVDALTEGERIVYESSIEGDRKTLVADSFIPGTMAVIYLLLLLYFKAIGGYKTVNIAEGK